MIEKISTFVRTVGRQIIDGKKIFVGDVQIDGSLLDGNASTGTSGQVLSTTASGVEWITVGSSNVGELDDLTDVQTGTPSDGQLLRYDSESGLWYNWTSNYLDTTDGLNDLNGVVITSAVSNQFLKYNGTNWVNANVLLSDLGDTSISSPSADQILVYGQPLGGTPGVNVWYNKTHSFLTNATNIDDLNNVVISEQASGDILRYNGTNWVNVSFSTLENDTLDSVTDRGNTTTNTINVGGVATDYVEFDTSVTLGGDESQGYMAWNSDVDTVSVYPYDSTWFNIGQDMHWHVKNGTAHTIERGQVVMATGAVGNSSKIEAGLMVADGTVSSKYILGVAIRDIASGEFGKVASQGIIRGVDTSSYQDGTLLWADPDTDGGLTSTEPDAPNLRLPIAFVVSAATNGAIAVRITTGNVLHELHDVDAPSPATGDLLRYSALTGIWENWTPTYISSFTEADPIFVASPAHGIASTDITNWNTAYGWGNHATAGYLTSLPAHNHDDRYYTETEVNTLLAGKAAVSHTHEIEDITGLADSLDLKLETESDTLNSVTGRGNTTSNTIFVGSARGSSGTYGTGIYGDNSGASVQFGTSAAVDSLGIIGAYSSQFNINSKNGPLSFQYYGTEYMNISASGALKLNSYGAGLLKTDANGNVTVDTNVYITADDQELTWEQSTKELSISDGNTVTLSGLASIADVEGYGYITTEVDTLNTVTTRGATTTNAIGTGNLTINSSGSAASYIYLLSSTTGESELRMGDTDTDAGSIAYNNNLDRMAFRTNAAERVYIDSSGNVGIGVSSPAQRLDVLGKMKITDDIILAQINGRIDYDNGSEGGALRFWSTSAASERMRITSAGNVGIGTTSPAYRLDINAGSANVGAIIRSSDSIAQIAFRDSTTGGDTNVRLGATGTDMTFFTGGAEKMRIDSTGNVGIGTTSPSAKLHIDGGTTGDTVKFLIGGNDSIIKLGDNGAGGPHGIQFDYETTNGDGMSMYYRTSPQHIVFENSTGTSGTGVMVIQRAGNVGIGTTSPSVPLTVISNSGGNAIRLLGRSSDGYAFTTFRNNADTATNGEIGVSNAQNMLFYTGTSERMRITSTGNVGIGATSPGQKLTVFGGNILIASNNYDLRGRDTSGNDRTLVRINSNNEAEYGWSGAGPVKFMGGGSYTERMRIHTNGNVGIGTTSPSAKLHVYNGEAIIATNTDGIKLSYSVGNSSGIIDTAFSDNNLEFRTNGSTKMWIANGGNVGIGTTSPASKLQVNVGTDQNVAINSTGGVARISAYDDAVSNSVPLIINGSDLRFTNNTSEVVRITGGNVGIGTTSPSEKLHVNSGSGNVPALFESTDALSLITFKDNSTTTTVGVGASADNIVFYSASERMRIDGSGYVGIGTTSPGTVLSVYNATVNRVAEFKSGDNRAVIEISDDDTTSFVGSEDGLTYIGQTSSASASNLNINSSGNVGIGTTSPSYKLDVNGSFNCTSMNVTNDITTSTGNVVLANDAGIYSFSDTVNAGADEAIFRISNANGAQAFRVSFVCNTSNYSVAKTYEVVHAYAGTPVAFKVVDTGPYSGNDFDVTFTDAATYTGIECSIANNSSTVNANIVTTIFLAGSTTAITITEL